MPPARRIEKGDQFFCLLKDSGRFSYDISYRGHVGQPADELLEVATDWLSDPDEDHGDEMFLVEVKVVKRITSQKQKAKVRIE